MKEAFVCICLKGNFLNKSTCGFEVSLETY